MARTVDTHTEHLQHTLEAAGRHRGASFVEVLQNCNIFNDGAWREFTDRDVPRRPDARPRARQAAHLRQGPRQGHPPPRPPPRDRDDRRGRRHRGGPAGPRPARRGPVPRADPVADVLARVPGAGRRPAPGGAARPTRTWSTPRSSRRSRSPAPATCEGAPWPARPGRWSEPMLCPVCRFDNFEGEDNCSNCGADLSASDTPQPAADFHDTILGDHLDAPRHRLPDARRAHDGGRRRHPADARERAPTASS